MGVCEGLRGLGLGGYISTMAIAQISLPAINLHSSAGCTAARVGVDFGQTPCSVTVAPSCTKEMNFSCQWQVIGLFFSNQSMSRIPSYAPVSSSYIGVENVWPCIHH